jgi:TfoX/Sxy family transcriptional regulator of competence genes
MPSKWKKSSPELVQAFKEAMQPIPAIQLRQMFGYPAAFANGQMFAGLHEEKMVLRLPEEEREVFLQLAGSRQFEPMQGRPMREYVVVPPALQADPDELHRWILKALDYASSLPPKAAKPRRKNG